MVDDDFFPETIADLGIGDVFHVCPVHYFPWIASSGSLKSKLQLKAEGFLDSHYRSTSHRADSERGFAEYVHLTVTKDASILMSKLQKGFPHLTLQVPGTEIAEGDYHLSRYNIARARRLRRGASPGLPEGPASGRYHDKKQIPIAVSKQERLAMVRRGLGSYDIEVLMRRTVHLGSKTAVRTYHVEDARLAKEAISRFGREWKIELLENRYTPKERFVIQVSEFIKRIYENPDWRGNGLDFDRLR